MSDRQFVYDDGEVSFGPVALPDDDPINDNTPDYIDRLRQGTLVTQCDRTTQEHSYSERPGYTHSPRQQLVFTTPAEERAETPSSESSEEYQACPNTAVSGRDNSSSSNPLAVA